MWSYGNSTARWTGAAVALIATPALAGPVTIVVGFDDGEFPNVAAAIVFANLVDDDLGVTVRIKREMGYFWFSDVTITRPMTIESYASAMPRITGDWTFTPAASGSSITNLRFKSNTHAQARVTANCTMAIDECEFDGLEGSSYNDTGGAIQIDGNVTVTDTEIKDFDITGTGGGIQVIGGSSSLMDVAISGCNANLGGGGLAVHGGTITVNNCTISSNSTQQTGGGVCAFGGTTTIESTTVASNTTELFGGGVGITKGTLTFSGGAASSSQTLYVAPEFGRAMEARKTSAISSTWMRLNTCPGLTIRRARPCRTVSNALRPGP